MSSKRPFQPKAFYGSVIVLRMTPRRDLITVMPMTDATAGQNLLRASSAVLHAMPEPASTLGKLPIKFYIEYIKIYHQTDKI